VVSLRVATREELERFDMLDRQPHARTFVNQTGLEQHQVNFADPNITYLCIEREAGDFCGYFILVDEPGTASVEFRRILIDQHKRGVGQAAIAAMENYCKLHLAAQRIWLDVYEDNTIGMHIHKKLGYQRFKEEVVEGRILYFYDKNV